jgi:hypothetical protein
MASIGNGGRSGLNCGFHNPGSSDCGWNLPMADLFAALSVNKVFSHRRAGFH